MANRAQQIVIDSILGGHSIASHSSAPDQYLGSVGIDPSESVWGTGGQQGLTAGGFGAGACITPVGVTKISGTLNSTVVWMETSPKDNNLYVYDGQGSVYTFNVSNTFTSLSDGGTMSGGASATGNGLSTGNGMAYYDNYMYFAKNTTIARYGPLNGTPTFDGDYWGTTLGKTALENTESYPNNIPNHVLFRHSDGRLYICDVVGNNGTLHYIKTKKTTVEGDTDDGSTYNALTMGYGLWPTALSHSGTQLAIGLYEGIPSGTNTRRKKSAKLAFWDPANSVRIDQILWDEFPDDCINALVNVNGILKIVSGQAGQVGFRVSTYIGGYSIQEDAFFSGGSQPKAGGVIGKSSRLVFGSSISYDSTSNRACVFALGTRQAGLSGGLFNILPSSATDNVAEITAVAYNPGIPDSIYSAWAGGGVFGIDKESSDCSNTYGSAFWFSKIYSIGRPFKITKIILNLEKAVASGLILTPSVWGDTANSKTVLTTINNTTYPNQKQIILRPENLVCLYNFFLELSWTGTLATSVVLPIIIEYEIIDA